MRQNDCCLVNNSIACPVANAEQDFGYQPHVKLGEGMLRSHCLVLEACHAS